jgi:TolA-binding protein
MKLSIVVLSAVAVSTLLAGCVGGKTGTIGDLRPFEENEVELTLETLDHETVRNEYQEILALIEDKDLKQQIERRIADVYMMEGQKTLIESGAKPSKSYYREAIKSYKEVLDKYPNSPDNAEVLYQLAKAYDMEGNQSDALEMLNRLTSRHPTFDHNAEAFFRMGDIYFNNKHYGKAETAYRAITKMKGSKLYINAHYMLGWSLYKQSVFEEGLQSFAVVLDDTLGASNGLDSLEKIERLLVDDTLHSMSLALVHQGGARYISKIGKLAKRDYVWMLYDELGEHYLEKERFEDSAATYRSYVTNYNKSEKAPELHSKLIQVYIKGGFPMQALPEKERFIQYYGLHSRYKGILGGVKEELAPTIKQYLEELARHYHAEGQQLAKKLKGIDSKNDKSHYKSVDLASVSYFEKAAKFYKEFVDTFPDDKLVSEMTYLRAETYYASRQYELAVADYENVAYEIKSKKENKNLAKAGYAAIISYQKIISPLDPASRKAKQWQKQAVNSMLRFAQTFHMDKRSPAVLTNAAEYLFSLDQYGQALQVASDLIDKNKSLDKSLKKTAYGIKAHSLFNLLRYAQAEQAYINQRALVPAESELYAKISERIATTIYKKSETSVTNDKQVIAIKQLLTIKTLAPNAKVRVTAQYDAATMMLAVGQWPEAIVELKELIALFPKHKLAFHFPRKLAFAQEKSGDFSTAAESYLALSVKDKDPDVRREALFLSAVLYEKSENYNTAIKRFKQYAHTYEQPFDTRMEARYHLARNYELIKDMTRHLYWLRRIVEGDKEGGSQRTDRSRWMAAWANTKYGDYFAWEFKRRKLRLPLDVSLPKKNQALENATGRYQQAADYNILEFVTLSGFKMAGLYQRFADELRAVSIPKGLSAADAESYTRILNEQAAPFTDLAIELHQANIDRAWQGQFNDWITKSFESMKTLQPARYQKVELEVSYGDEIR